MKLKPPPDRIQVIFSAIGPSIREQFSDFLPKETARRLDELSVCATRLFVSGLLSVSEIHRVRKKLTKRIARELRNVATKETP